MQDVRTGLALLAVVVWTVSPAVAASQTGQTEPRANINGIVRNEDGDPVANVKIELIDAKGAVIGSSESASAGSYRIDCVEQGQYTLSLRPGTTGYQAETVVVPLGERGVRVDWNVAEHKPALAIATADGGICDADVADTTPGPVGTARTSRAILVRIAAGLVLTGAVIGGLGASGAFHSSSGTVQTSSQ